MVVRCKDIVGYFWKSELQTGNRSLSRDLLPCCNASDRRISQKDRLTMHLRSLNQFEYKRGERNEHTFGIYEILVLIVAFALKKTSERNGITYK